MGKVIQGGIGALGKVELGSLEPAKEGPLPSGWTMGRRTRQFLLSFRWMVDYGRDERNVRRIAGSRHRELLGKKSLSGSPIQPSLTSGHVCSALGEMAR